ncbi:hypothetical protein ABL78_6069 [Leptomonas seymouri]|uniref:Protein Abitram n=1 Tax=Leptomonas seymouri TaxID=5684 RepID=A0A0N0P4J2_LEPSE|nr:hypothetical protein ABL78_6069 [Leptomonas seymouri]|eukprot:KPI84887.1 hypothetical protein ABL78_6069 [Leptomonas seymouri]
MSESLITTSPPAGEAVAPSTTVDWSYVRSPLPRSFDYFIERYYHQYCIRDAKRTAGNNCRILQHSNGLCVLCVDSSHALVQKCGADPAVTVSKVEFFKGRTIVTPESIQVVGKKKKNALVCQNDTKLCGITLSDGTEYSVPACVNGFVLELNATVMEQPWMVAAAPMAEGYLAVINPTSKADFSGYGKVWTATGGDAAGEEDD